MKNMILIFHFHLYIINIVIEIPKRNKKKFRQNDNFIFL